MRRSVSSQANKGSRWRWVLKAVMFSLSKKYKVVFDPADALRVVKTRVRPGHSKGAREGMYSVRTKEERSVINTTVTCTREGTRINTERNGETKAGERSGGLQRHRGANANATIIIGCGDRDWGFMDG